MKLFQDSRMNVNVSLFSGVAGKKIGDFPLIHLLSSMQLEWCSKVWALRNCHDEEKQKEMKKKLPCFTVGGVYDGGHAAENLVNTSGFLCLDIDQADNRDMNQADMKNIAKTIPSCAYCGLSARGKGCFLVIHILRPERHKEYCQTLNLVFRRMGIVLDAQCFDPNRTRFCSYDWDAYFNHYPEPFDVILPTPTKFERHHAKLSMQNKCTSESTLARIHELVRKIKNENIDITNDYSDWLEIGFSLASLGEEGRSVFHAVSSVNQKYNFLECDTKFSHLLRSGRGCFSVATFLQKCKENGVN